jgi:hypothetical protein
MESSRTDTASFFLRLLLPRFFSIDLVWCRLPVTYSIDLVRHLLPDPSIWSCASCAAVAAMASCWPPPLGFSWPPPVELPWPSSLAIAEPSLRLLPLCDAAVCLLPRGCLPVVGRRVPVFNYRWVLMAAACYCWPAAADGYLLLLLDGRQLLLKLLMPSCCCCY